MQYRYYPVRPERMTAEFLRDEFQKLSDRLEEAERSDSSDQFLRLFDDWNALIAYSSSESSRIRYAYSRDLNDASLEEADRYLRKEVGPVVDQYESRMLKGILSSKHVDLLAERFGNHLLRVMKTWVEPMDPINSELQVAAGDLVARYTKLFATAQAEIGGRAVTLTELGSLQLSPDENVRREAFVVMGEWMLAHRDELREILDGLVKLRHQMALNLGRKNFVPLGYLGMGRVDYGPEEVAKLRRSIEEYVVPLRSKLHRAQARELGQPTLKPWNVGYSPSTTLPRGIVPVDTQLEKAQRVFDSLSPRLAAHFERMRREELIDLENRMAKRQGAFCTNFTDEGRPAILCNSTGDANDVRTLMHEMGHAFQKWESSSIEPLPLQWPTADTAEIHSMGMEYLSMRHMGEFFDEENERKFRRGRWRKMISGLCSMAAIDEFQHHLYERPEMTPQEREETWGAVHQKYLPDVDNEGYEQYENVRFYAVAHIFRSPFYYIDYAVAELGAAQLAMIDAEDHERAMSIYLDLCAMGGTRSILDVFAAAGLRSPFDPELVRNLMEYAAREMGEVSGV